MRARRSDDRRRRRECMVLGFRPAEPLEHLHTRGHQGRAKATSGGSGDLPACLGAVLIPASAALSAKGTSQPEFIQRVLKMFHLIHRSTTLVNRSATLGFLSRFPAGFAPRSGIPLQVLSCFRNDCMLAGLLGMLNPKMERCADNTEKCLNVCGKKCDYFA